LRKFFVAQSKETAKVLKEISETQHRAEQFFWLGSTSPQVDAIMY